ncbi:hypothetical protein CN601_16860 [Bacillus sp. AFS017336]|nr:hypothetical protein CN692_12080 [Bacillus sp. AFS002410]PEL08424.1 hypothetical protein CN601_16860 [Bacillus sp. AFS017336]
MLLSTPVFAEGTPDESGIPNELGQKANISEILKNGFLSKEELANAKEKDKFGYETMKDKPNEVLAEYKPNDQVRMIVEVENATDSAKDNEQTKEKKDKAIQDDVISKLSKTKTKKTIKHRFYKGFNGFSIDTQFKNLEEIQSIDGVKKVHLARTFQPSMAASKELVQAQKVWESYGYKGEGLVVGVVDSGIDWTHKDMTITEKGKKLEKLTRENSASKFNETAVNETWYSDKVPTGYDWADNDTDVIPHGANGNPHGTHVSGTIGANGDEANDGVLGIAPGVQLLAEKVFSDQGGGAWEDDIIAGIQHAMTMGADVINMSLGSDAGWVGEDDDLVQKAIREATEQGTLVVVAGGNAAYSTQNNLLPWSTQPFAENPDIGTVGQPGVSPYALSVASYENTKIHMNALQSSDGFTLPYRNSSGMPFSNALVHDQSYDLVYVGEGTTADFNGKDVAGKIVVAKPIPPNGYGSYSYIQGEARKRGALAVIVVPPSAVKDYPNFVFSSYFIPSATTGKAVGDALIQKLSNGQIVKMKSSIGIYVDNPDKDTMSYFSSYGAPYTLDFKPEISAPGGNIYSTVPGNQYDVYSGTSMATPHVAGGSALVLQSLYDKGLKHSEEAALKTKIALMNTAKIVQDPRTNNEVPYSPRIQGSGLMQIKNAISTPVLVTRKNTPLEQAGAVALKEIKNDRAVFNLNVEALQNLKTKEELEYTVNVDLLTDGTETKNFDFNNDGKSDYSNEYLTLKSKRVEGASIYVNDEKITDVQGAALKIKQGQEKNLKIEIRLPRTLKKDAFLEGFVRLVPTGKNSSLAVPLTVPYMGYNGEWDQPKNIDPVAWDNDAFLGYTALWDDMTETPIGYNRAIGDFDVVDHMAVSPNSVAPGVFPSFTAFRNLKETEMYVEDSKGKKVNWLGNLGEYTENGSPLKLRKNSMFSGNYFYKFDEFDFPDYTWDETDEKGNLVPDGNYNYVLKTTLDYKNAKPQVVKLPIKVDSGQVKVTDIKVEPKDGKYEISFKAADNKGGSGYKGAILFVDNQYYETKIGETSVLVPNNPKSIVVMGVDYAYNQSYSVWGDPSFINENMVLTFFNVSGTNVTTSTPATITSYANNRVDWKVYVKDANGKVVDTAVVEDEHTLRLKWTPAEKVQSGTYYISADVVTKDGFKITTTPKKITVVK